MKKSTKLLCLFVFTLFLNNSFFAQTTYTFTGAGADSSGNNAGYKTISTSPTEANIEISDNMTYTSNLFYPDASGDVTVTFTLKGDGINVDSFDVTDMNWGNFTGSSQLDEAITKIVFTKTDLTTVTWSSFKAAYQATGSFTTANHSVLDIFSSSSAITNVTSIEITVDLVGGGSTQNFELRNITLDNLTAPVSNANPTISLANTTLNYTEGDSTILIDGAATVSDADGDADWNGGTLVAQITANNEAADELSISDTDGDGTAIIISGINILANGTDIGDLSTSGGTVTNGTALTITFDSDATNANVQEVLQSLRYRNTSATPGTSNRTVTITATDTNAGSANDTRTIAVALALNGTWDGSTNNDWNTAANWSTNAVPTAGSDVTIPNGLANYPTISSAVTVNSINISSGASLIANASVTGATTYNRNLATNNWYLVSSPVSGETIEDLRTNNNFASGSVAGRIGLAPYDNTQGAGSRWGYQTTSSTGALNNGQGYSVKLVSAGDLKFTGNVNSSNINRGITIGAGNAFNLIGNPFTAYLNSGTGGFLADNAGVLTSQTLWLWNQATNSYDTKVTGDNFKIAPGQGFFVECSTAGNVTFETADLSHETTGTFQRATAKIEIHLNISTGNETSKTKLYFINGATKGFDNGYDGKMFTGVANNYAIYSQLVSENKGINYAIQSLPLNEIEQIAIPIGLNATADSEILFSSSSLSLPSNTKIYLEDRVNSKFIDITEKNHTVTLDKESNGIGQYYLRASSKDLNSLNPITNSINDVSIFNSSDNKISIVGLQAEKANIKAFSLSGKQVLNKVFNSNGYSEIETPKLATGIYIIELTSNLGKTTKKIILK